MCREPDLLKLTNASASLIISCRYDGFVDGKLQSGPAYGLGIDPA